MSHSASNKPPDGFLEQHEALISLGFNAGYDVPLKLLTAAARAGSPETALLLDSLIEKLRDCKDAAWHHFRGSLIVTRFDDGEEEKNKLQ